VATNHPYISEFGQILLFIIGGALFIIITLFVSKLIRPDRPGAEKLTAYESGEEPVGAAWTQFNIRFYIVALIFILFEIEIIFLFPWATVFAKKEYIAETNGAWGWFAVIEAVIFIFVLALGLAYAWAKGHLDWIKPKPESSPFESPVPREYYQKINQQYKSSRLKDQRSTPEKL
jgi:NADH-quinone oxidoreductase subunit A